MPPSVVDSAVSLRPTTSMARSVLFNALRHNPSLLDLQIQGSAVLDLFCGCGVVGLEFLSLGAKTVTFIDISLQAIGFLKENLSQLNVLDRARVEKRKLPSFIVGRFDIIFLDPPYLDLKSAVRQIEFLRDNGNLNNRAIIIVEADKSSRIDNIEGFDLILERKVNSKTKLAFFRLRGKE